MSLEAKPGFKFVLLVTLPNETKMAIGAREGMLALLPIGDRGQLRGVIAWSNTADIKKWMEDFRQTNGEDAWMKIKQLRPEIRQVEIAQ